MRKAPLASAHMPECAEGIEDE